MNWNWTDEEKLLKQSAQEFFREKMPIEVLRYIRDQRIEKGYLEDKWQAMVELGWTGILIPEEYGGLAFGYRGMGTILEEAGRTLAPSPLLSTVVCASSIIRDLADHEQKSEILPAIAEGKRLIAIAHDEHDRHRGCHVETQASRSGEGYVINGRKTMVIDGPAADQFIVLARTSSQDAQSSSGLSCFLVDRSQSGLTVRDLRMIDGLPCSQLDLDQVFVEGKSLLGREGQAWPAFSFMMDAACCALAAEMFGGASQAFEMTLSYLKERKQFGVIIGSFQALQHRMAQMYSELEVCRSIVQRALSALDDNDSKRSLYASLAKAKVSEVYQHVAKEAIQLHGGIGMTDEHNIGLFLKRSRITAEWFGNPSFHRDRYASLLEF
jgi:alkylation response protein AidB-like acyl-CoA dehydrogenase